MTEISDSSITAARNLRAMVGRLRRRLREVASDDGLTPSQTSVLIRLTRDGPASASELAGAERVRPQSMATTLAGLDRHGLINRSPDPADGRRQLITLTAQGRARGEHDRRERQEWLVRAMQDRFTEAERGVVNQALALLERITDNER